SLSSLSKLCIQEAQGIANKYFRVLEHHAMTRVRVKNKLCILHGLVHRIGVIDWQHGIGATADNQRRMVNGPKYRMRRIDYGTPADQRLRLRSIDSRTAF